MGKKKQMEKIKNRIDLYVRVGAKGLPIHKQIGIVASSLISKLSMK